MKDYSLGKVVRAADGAGLENQCAVTPYQEFESLTFRESAVWAWRRGRLRQSRDCSSRPHSSAPAVDPGGTWSSGGLYPRLIASCRLLCCLGKQIIQARGC